jgi:hypothetical protein
MVVPVAALLKRLAGKGSTASLGSPTLCAVGALRRLASSPRITASRSGRLDYAV